MKRKHKSDWHASLQHREFRLCRCNTMFIPHRFNQVHCPACIEIINEHPIKKMMAKAEVKAKAMADCANATIYTSALCDQAFLRSLVPKPEVMPWCW